MRAYFILIGRRRWATFLRTCNMRFEMTAQRLTTIVDGIAMTLVNAALLLALPMSAVLFVSHSL